MFCYKCFSFYIFRILIIQSLFTSKTVFYYLSFNDIFYYYFSYWRYYFLHFKLNIILFKKLLYFILKNLTYLNKIITFFFIRNDFFFRLPTIILSVLQTSISELIFSSHFKFNFIIFNYIKISNFFNYKCCVFFLNRFLDNIFYYKQYIIFFHDF